MLRRLQTIEAVAQLWAGLLTSACEGLNETASAEMRAFTERLESWYNERMSKFDEDAAFREVQEGKYGDRDGYSRSVLGVAEGKISGARSKALQAAEKAAAEAARVAAEEAEAEEEEAQTMVIVGSRAAPRSVGDSPVPVDVISGDEFVKNGSADMVSMLASVVPSFNVNSQPISDAATLIRPANLRGLPPDNT